MTTAPESPRRSRPLLEGIGLGAAHALLLWLAFPPIGFGLLGVIAPVPLFLLALRTDRPSRSGLGVAIGTLPFWAYHHWWVFAVSAAGAPPLIVLQSLWAGLFIALGAIGSRRLPGWQKPVALALVWTGVEFFRGRLFFDGYPWFLSAHPLADLPLAKWASVVGVYGVGLLVALLGASFTHAAISRSPGWRKAILPLACLVLLACGGLLPTPASDRAARIAVIQTNLPQSNKLAWELEDRIERFRAWASLSAEAGAMQPPAHLIVWPETMFPGATLTPQAIAEFERYEQSQGRSGSIGTLFVAPLLELQDQLGVPMLLGALGYDNLAINTDADGGLRLDRDASYNSAFLITDGAIDPDRYDKIFLTPFGETMPYISKSPALEQALLDFAAGGMDFDLSAGTVPVRFEIETQDAGAFRVATPICFEATISHVCRRLVYHGAERQTDVLINLTNDGWFGSFDPGRANHLLIARWRAIELGTPVVRAANTGISCVVDARGRVLEAAAPRQPANLLPVEVPLPGDSRTIYAGIGDLAGWLGVLATLGLLGVAARNRRRDQKTVPSETSEPKPSPQP